MLKAQFQLPPQVKQNLLSQLEAQKQKTDIGLYYLDVTELEEIFVPVMQKAFGITKRFQRVWGHYMDKGGERPWHKHSAETFLFYLQIPDGDCGNFVYAGGEIIPKEGDLYIMEPKLQHKILPNKTDKTRWAIAAEVIPASTLSQLE